MDGNNILLVVSASRENYWFTANIHSSLPYFLYFSFFFFFFSSPHFCLTISPSPLSVSVLLPPHCPTHVYFDTQLLLGATEGRPRPSVS